MEQNNAALLLENQLLYQKAEQLSEEIIELNSQVTNLTSELICREILEKGFASGQMAPRNFQHLNQVIESMPHSDDGIITGQYNMRKLSVDTLYAEAQIDLLPFELSAKKFLSHRFNTNIEVKMDEAAILNNPPIANGRGESAQIYHADDISGTGVTFIISLSNNCLSTYCLPIHYYGDEYPISLDYHELIGCNYLKLLNDRKSPILEAVNKRYQNVCNMLPVDFFTKAEGGQIVPAGSYTAFRHDLLHAGPGGNQMRRVLFLHFRIRAPVNRPLKNIQYRFDALMKLCGYKKAVRQSLHNKWTEAGHWSPYESS